MELAIFPPAFGLRNAGPFCLKSELLLRSLGLEYTLLIESNPGKGPKGKLPFLRHEGKVIADSELIAQYLDDLTQGKVYGALTAQQHAAGLALSRLAEDHLYWMMVASRWLDDDWWPHVVHGFFGAVPVPVRALASRIARRNVAQTYRLQGLGRHSLEEQRGFAQRDLQALEDAVPATGCLFGAEPCIYDCSIVGLMAGIFDNTPNTWLTDVAQPFQNLRDYTERVQETVGVWGRD